MLCFSKSYPFKFFKVCLSQILLGPFLNTISHLSAPMSRAKLKKVLVIVTWQALVYKTFKKQSFFSRVFA